MHSLRRWFAVAVVTIAATLGAASAASASTAGFNNWTTTGSLTIAKLRQSITLPAGSTFNGSADLSTGQLTGNVSIPQFTARLSIFGLPVDATLQFVPSQPVTGTLAITPTTLTVNASTSAIIKITRLSSPLLPLLNLSGPFCRTSAPVVLALDSTGPTASIFSGITFQGTTTIPLLQGCGLATGLLDALMSGPGNAFSVKIAPPGA